MQTNSGKLLFEAYVNPLDVDTVSRKMVPRTISAQNRAGTAVA